VRGDDCRVDVGHFMTSEIAMIGDNADLQIKLNASLPS